MRALGLAFLFWCFWPSVAGAAELADPRLSASREGERIPVQMLEPLRELHAGAVQLLTRYATLEALVTAEARGMDDTKAFWTGAASMIPGAGQMINQDYLQGSLLIFNTGLSLASLRELSAVQPAAVRNPQAAPYYYAARGLRDGIMTWAMLQAAAIHYRRHADRTAAIWTGAASSFPGAGQAINQQWWEAAGFLLAWSGAAYLTASLGEVVYGGPEEPARMVQSSPRITLAALPDGARIEFTAAW